MGNKKLNIINESIKNLGFSNIYEFAEVQLIKILEKNIETTKEVIIKLEKKYKMKLENFNKNFYETDNFSLIEKEDDEMDWKINSEFYITYKKNLNNLKNGEDN